MSSMFMLIILSSVFGFTLAVLILYFALKKFIKKFTNIHQVHQQLGQYALGQRRDLNSEQQKS